jgi:hypothetical protein
MDDLDEFIERCNQLWPKEYLDKRAGERLEEKRRKRREYRRKYYDKNYKSLKLLKYIHPLFKRYKDVQWNKRIKIEES